MYQIKVVEKSNNFVSKIVPFMWRMLLHAGLVRLHVRKHTQAFTHTRTQTHKKEICNIYCFYTATVVS
jgi:hypothetical protein